VNPCGKGCGKANNFYRKTKRLLKKGKIDRAGTLENKRRTDNGKLRKTRKSRWGDFEQGKGAAFPSEGGRAKKKKGEVIADVGGQTREMKKRKKSDFPEKGGLMPPKNGHLGKGGRTAAKGDQKRKFPTKMKTTIRCDGF